MLKFKKSPNFLKFQRFCCCLDHLVTVSLLTASTIILADYLKFCHFRHVNSYSFTRKSVLNSPCLLNNLLNANVTSIFMAKHSTLFRIETGSVKLLIRSFSLMSLINILLSPITQEHKREFVYKGLFPEKVEIGKPSRRCNAEITEPTVIVGNGLQVKIVKSDCLIFGSHVALSRVCFLLFTTKSE